MYVIEKMNFKLYFITFYCLLFTVFLRAQCYTKITAFGNSEKLSYHVSYNLGFLWFNAGEVYFKTDSVTKNNREVVHFESVGTTYPDYDWIFKVRDKYQSYVDKETYKPLLFERTVNEGNTYTYNKYVFDYKRKKISFTYENKKIARYSDTINYTDCSFDPISLLYYCRNIDFSKVKENEKIPLTMYIDTVKYEVYIRYVGKETITTRSDETYNCIKFRPMLVDGSIFKGGEEITVWVTDDENKIPIYVEAKIMVGAIKVYLFEAKGLIHPLNSLIENDLKKP